MNGWFIYGYFINVRPQMWLSTALWSADTGGSAYWIEHGPFRKEHVATLISDFCTPLRRFEQMNDRITTTLNWETFRSRLPDARLDVLTCTAVSFGDIDKIIPWMIPRPSRCFSCTLFSFLFCYCAPHLDMVNLVSTPRLNKLSNLLKRGEQLELSPQAVAARAAHGPMVASARSLK